MSTTSSYNHRIKYRTFNQLLDSVADDFSSYDREGLIEPSQLIKVVQRVNGQFKHRITTTKQALIEIRNGVAKIPIDMEKLNYSLYTACGVRTYGRPDGKKVEGIDTTCPLFSCCDDEEVWVNECGGTYQIVVSSIKNSWNEYYDIISRVKVKDYDSLVYCKDARITATYKGKFFKVNVDSGNLYLNYEGILEDDEGNLLVLDHELVNDYYEYRVKQRILENMYLNGEDVTQRLQLIEQRINESRREANSVVKGFNFKEIEETVNNNRQSAYNRYYSIFQ